MTCSFVDKDVTEFWQFKKRKSGGFPPKKDVNKTWVLSKDLFINGETGASIDASKSQYAWIGHLRQGHGIAPNNEAIVIKAKLTTDGLQPLMKSLHTVMQHNFAQSLMVLGSVGMSMHYKKLINL
jgi:hypothetical protein